MPIIKHTLKFISQQALNKLKEQYLSKLLVIMEDFKTGKRKLPEQLRKRNGNVWLSLYQVALLDGERWGDKLLDAAIKMETITKGLIPPDERTRLLRAIWGVFQEPGNLQKEFISTSEIIQNIAAITNSVDNLAENDSPWYSFRQTGYPITAKNISDILRKFNMVNTESVQMQIKGKRHKGYEREAIERLYTKYGNRG